MARPSITESRSVSSPVSNTNLKAKPLKPPGIIILPPAYRQQDDDDSPPSSTSDSRRAESTTSLPDLPGGQHSLNRRASTSTSSLNVKFAPLPQLAPRKRRSTAPLGIASRALMMRRRRAGTPGYDMNGDPLPPTPPMWSEEEVERHTQRILAERSGQMPPRERDIDDPFLTLGKMVKGAGKQLWRKVNHKKPGDIDEKGGDAPGRTGGVVVAERMVLAPISGSGDNASVGEEEGGVWEEEVGSRFPLNVSQTETIVEGQYSWSAAKLKPPTPLEDSGSVSDDASGKEHNLSSAEVTEEDSTREDSRSTSLS
ncbi:hypothetical protein C8R43DRAFT_990109 [Mycena crocata]|nr:hypothetical protein C8R43DRAFT_990109 [Mycena crocata]